MRSPRTLWRPFPRETWVYTALESRLIGVAASVMLASAVQRGSA